MAPKAGRMILLTGKMNKIIIVITQIVGQITQIKNKNKFKVLQ